MYEIKTEIMDKLTKEFKTELDNREYNYETYAIDKILKKWFNQKQNLFSLLSKHPLWNPEKFMIQFDQDYSRKLVLDELHVFCDWLEGKVICWSRTELEKSGITVEENDRRKFILTWLRTEIKEQFFNDSMINAINEINSYNENYKIRTNMKASKAIGKICREEGWDKIVNPNSKADSYGTRYAALCDNLNPIKVKRHTVISLNPLDFLLMSYGDSWESCHYIGKYGDGNCYSSGTISYMLDEHSFLFYTVSNSHNGEDIELAPKSQRQVFGYNDEVFLQSRLYPQSNDCGAKAIYDDIRNIVQKIIADCLEKPNMWTISRNIDTINEVVEHGEDATCYPDWHSGNPGSNHCCLSTLQSRENGKQFRKIVLGAAPICIFCGYEHDISENISCCGSETYYCEECGGYMDEDDVFWVGDHAYCRDCVTYCDRCRDYHLNDDCTRVGDSYYCESCLYEVASQCDNCGEWEYLDYCYFTEDGTVYCESCGSEYTFYCEECGCTHNKDNGIEVDGEWYCKDCIDKVAIQCVECGEYVLNGDIIATENNCYCEDCFDKKAFTCEKCDENFDKKNGCYDKETDTWYCKECYAELLKERENENEEESEGEYNYEKAI